MQIQRSKNLAAVFFVLVLTVTLFVVAVPNVKALGISTTSHAYVHSNLVEPGQVNYVGGYITPAPPSGYYYSGIQIIVTRPDALYTVYGSLTSDAAGGVIIMYSPSQIGEYTVEFDYPGQWIGPDYYEPSSDSTGFSSMPNTVITICRLSVPILKNN